MKDIGPNEVAGPGVGYFKQLENQKKAAEMMGAQNQTMAWDRDKPAEPHPRESLLSDLNDQEQRLLDKLHAIREMKNEICCLPRDEAERIVKLSRLAARIQNVPSPV